DCRRGPVRIQRDEVTWHRDPQGAATLPFSLCDGEARDEHCGQRDEDQHWSHAKGPTLLTAMLVSETSTFNGESHPVPPPSGSCPDARRRSVNAVAPVVTCPSRDWRVPARRRRGS